MTKKTLLKLDYKPPFHAIGIFSPQKEYRLCWLINRHLKTQLTRLPDFQYMPQGHAERLLFPLFSQAGRDGQASLVLIANRHANTCLFKEPKNMDYLLLLSKTSAPDTPDEVIKSLRKVPQIEAAYVVDKWVGKTESAFFQELELALSQVG